MEKLQAGVRHELEGSKVKWVDQLGGCGNSPGERWKWFRLEWWRVEMETETLQRDLGGWTQSLTLVPLAGFHNIRSFTSSPDHTSAHWRQALPLLPPMPNWTYPSSTAFKLPFIGHGLTSSSILVMVFQIHTFSMSVDGYLMVPTSFTTQPSSGRKGQRMIAGRRKSRLKNKKIINWKV